METVGISLVIAGVSVFICMGLRDLTEAVNQHRKAVRSLEDTLRQELQGIAINVWSSKGGE